MTNTAISALAAVAGVGASYFTRVLRLGFLAPDVATAIVQGRQPPELNAKQLFGVTVFERTARIGGHDFFKPPVRLARDGKRPSSRENPSGQAS